MNTTINMVCSYVAEKIIIHKQIHSVSVKNQGDRTQAHILTKNYIIIHIPNACLHNYINAIIFLKLSACTSRQHNTSS